MTDKPAKSRAGNNRTFIKRAKARRFAIERAKGKSQAAAYLVLHPEKADLPKATLYMEASRFANNPIVVDEIERALAESSAGQMLTRQRAVTEAQDFYDTCINAEAYAAAASAMRLKFAAAGVDTERSTQVDGDVRGLQASIERLKTLHPALASQYQAIIDAQKAFTTGDQPANDAETAAPPIQSKVVAGS